MRDIATVTSKAQSESASVVCGTSSCKTRPPRVALKGYKKRALPLFHIHILLGDGNFNFNVWQLSVPFTLPYRTLSAAVGVISMYALLLVVASFYLKRFIGYKTWRSIHYVTFAMYVGVTLHGIFSGTDTAQPWARLIYLSTGIGPAAMVLYRISERAERGSRPDRGPSRTPRLVTAADGD